MKTDTKMALALVASVFIVAVAYVGSQEYDRARTVSEVKQLFSGMDQDIAHASADARRDRLARQYRQDRVRARDQAVRTLSSSQRCISGVVIEQHGSDYVQLTDAQHRPVTCTGRLASEPIR